MSTYHIVSLSSGFAGPSSRKRSWRTLMPVEVSVTAITGNPICVKDFGGSGHSQTGAAPYLRNPVFHDLGNVKSFGASVINIETAQVRTCVPVASPIPSHRSSETVFEYKCFLRYNETPFRNLSSPTYFDSMRSTIGVHQLHGSM